MTEAQGGEFEKFDSVMRALIIVPKQEIADEGKKTKRHKKKRKKS